MNYSVVINGKPVAIPPEGLMTAKEFGNLFKATNVIHLNSAMISGVNEELVSDFQSNLSSGANLRMIIERILRNVLSVSGKELERFSAKTLNVLHVRKIVNLTPDLAAKHRMPVILFQSDDPIVIIVK